jgi:hypothetical protein
MELAISSEKAFFRKLAIKKIRIQDRTGKIIDLLKSAFREGTKSLFWIGKIFILIMRLS